MRIDLHLHSNVSDGLYSPEEVYQKAKAAGLNIMSLTDHDSCSGYGRLKKASLNEDIKVICGAELSSNYEDNEIHILAYFKEGISKELENFVYEAQINRDRRISEGLDNLRKIGIDLSHIDLMQLCHGDSIGRNHLAQLLVKRGYVDSPIQAFQNYLKYDLNIVPRTKTSVRDVIEIIKSSNGISVWAHPPFKLFDRYLPTFMEMGLNGVEAYNRKKPSNDSFYYHTVAEKFGLLVTAGSDWHGLRDENFLTEGNYPVEIMDKFIKKIFAPYKVRDNNNLTFCLP